MVQAIAIVAAAAIAIWQLLTARNEGRLQKTIALHRAWFEGPDPVNQYHVRLSEAVPAELEAYSRKLHFPDAVQSAADFLNPYVKAMVKVHNYFDDAMDLYKRNAIDHDYFLSRFELTIEEAQKYTPTFNFLRELMRYPEYGALPFFARKLQAYRRRQNSFLSAWPLADDLNGDL